jgi:hypothetical protein
MSFYYTLAGLPPKLSNQQYNCHFLSTSNTAGALELADQIVDEIKSVIFYKIISFFFRSMPKLTDKTFAPLPAIWEHMALQLLTMDSSKMYW